MRRKAVSLRLALLVVTVGFPLSPSPFGQSGLNTPSPSPLMVLRERQTHFDFPADVNCPPGHLVIPGLSYSQVDILSDGRADQVVWSVPPCSQLHDKAFSWTVPVGSKVKRFTLGSHDLDHFRDFLDQPNTKTLTGFLSDTPEGAGDYEIEILRPSGLQRIEVMGLLPGHVEFERDRTLLRLICLTKQIAGDKLPLWCSGLP